MLKERLIEYHIERLKDKNRDTRLDAIRELILLEAEEALPALQTVFEKDDDEEVRKAAQQGGREIFKLQLNKKKSATQATGGSHDTPSD